MIVPTAAICIRNPPTQQDPLPSEFTPTRARQILQFQGGISVDWLLDRVMDHDWRDAVAEGRERERPESFTTRLIQGLRYGFVEVVDHTGPWIILGVVVASLKMFLQLRQRYLSLM